MFINPLKRKFKPDIIPVQINVSFKFFFIFSFFPVIIQPNNTSVGTKNVSRIVFLIKDFLIFSFSSLLSLIVISCFGYPLQYMKE